MRRISPISWVLIVIGVALVVVGIIYLTSTPPNLPSFIPGAVAHPHAHRAYKHKYTKRAIASFIVAALAFIGVYYKDLRRA
jgi:branched-subunit amino acid ABC-type transport system permease component